MNNTETELDIIENKETRDGLMSHVEVLAKVGKIVSIPGTEYTNTLGVATYYGVDREVVKKVVQNNHSELVHDGLLNLTGNEAKDYIMSYGENISPKDFKNVPGGFICKDVKLANRSNLLFNRRSILRVGMLLRDSDVAKSVRTYLLNVERDAPNIAKGGAVAEQIPKDQRNDYVNSLLEERDQLISQIADLQDDNARLRLHRHVTKTQRFYINQALQDLAKLTDTHAAMIWDDFYLNLYTDQSVPYIYEYPKPYIAYCFESDWEALKQEVQDMYTMYDQDLSEHYFDKVNISTHKSVSNY